MPLYTDVFWQSIACRLQENIPNDPLLECYTDGFSKLMDQADDQLSRADRNLHTFPFKDVKPCWFRLYTDASLAKVLNSINSIASLSPSPRDFLSVHDCLDEIVPVLDMALIMAGGLGREEIISEILTRLGPISHADGNSAEPPAKRRRVWEHSDDKQQPLDHLPADVTSIPNLQYPVRQMTQPPMTVFSKYMDETRTPAVLTGILNHWPALRRWKHVSYWLDQTLDGRRLVPIEVGRSYTDDDWGQKIIPFREFLSNHVLQTAKPQADGSSTDDKTGYLAQHDLLGQIPSLRKDITIPDYCFLDAPSAEPGTPVALSKSKKDIANKTSHPSAIPSDRSAFPCNLSDRDEKSDAIDIDREVQTNIWFGPAWTISPLHHDPYHNILCQVVGKKYVRLYSPHQSAALLPRREDEPAPHNLQTGAADCESNNVAQQPPGETIDMSNTSQIDVAAMELSPHEDWDETYPGISQVPYVECILEAGQALYIPIGWWHYVRSCSVGISVSFWW